MKIMDVRCRPPFKPYLDTMYDLSVDYPFASHLFPKRFGMSVADSVKEKSMELLFKEMDRCGEYVGVVSIRKNSRGYENDDLIELVNDYPERFMGACGIPAAQSHTAIQMIQQYIIDGKCIAPFMEPGMEGVLMDDESVFPTYEFCEKNNIPMLISFGGFHGPTNDYCNPIHAENVAKVFPKLKFCLCHGGFPWIVQSIRLAFAEPNVYLSPDIYALHSPGGQDYMEAANYMLYDKFLYGSAYPCVDIEGSVNYYLKNLRDEVVEDIMYNNAVKFFGLSE